MQSVEIAMLACLFVIQAAAVRAQSVQSFPRHANATQSITGNYLGLEKMETLSPEDPFTHWFHENTLFIRNNELVLDKQPITIRRGKKTYSASDGGFLTYRGEIFSTQDGTYVALRLIDSDYIAFRTGPKECEPYSRISVFPLRIENGTLNFDQVAYKANPISTEAEELWAKTLTDESVEYNGKKHYGMNPKAALCPMPPEFSGR